MLSFTFSFFASPVTYALSVDPVLDDVLSLVCLNSDDRNVPHADSNINAKKGNKTADMAGKDSMSPNFMQRLSDNPSSSEPAVVIAPLAELPTIGTFSVEIQQIRTAYSDNSSVKSSAVLYESSSRRAVAWLIIVVVALYGGGQI